MDNLDAIAADIAAKGLAHAAELEAEAAQLRERLADPIFLNARAEAQLRAEAEAFTWEREEDLPLDAPQSVWAASTAYFATGEGLTTYYYVTLARSEAEFRRKFALRLNPGLVDAAQLSDRLRAWVAKRWHGGALSIFIEHYVNYA